MINSKEYWDNRFQSGNWDELGGQEQNIFFNKLALEFLPQWLIEDIEDNNCSIADIGCAEGSGTSLFKTKFARSKVTGIDFSESAINNAISRYPACEFKCQDITEVLDKYDIVFSSNVLEHFKDPFDKMAILSKLSTKYLIILLPFQEENLHEEHFIRFDYNSFTLKINDLHLCYYKVINTKNYPSTMWPGKQILLVYGNANHINFNDMKLSRVVNNDFEEKESFINIINSKIEETYNKINKYDKAVGEKNQQIIDYKQEIIEKENQLQVYKQEVEEKSNELLNLKLEMENKIQQLENEKLELLNKCKLRECKLADDNLNKILELENMASIISNKLKISQNIVLETKKNALMLADTKLFKLVHLMYRIKLQLIKGNINEKKRFFKWLKYRKNINKGVQEHSFNPLFQIINRLDHLNTLYNQNLSEFNDESYNLKALELNQKHENSMKECEQSEIKLNLKLDNYNYKKQDIIFFSVISWEFRYQRPQHLAQNLANMGHRVFYFNADFKDKFAINRKDNLYIINLDNYYGSRIYDVDFSNDDYIKKQLSDILNSYNIRDCSVIVEYPSWYHACNFLKANYNFNIVFDYIDDYEGFEETTNTSLRKLTENLFKLSDLTVATSNFLYEKTKVHCNNVKVIRNGTEFEFFNKALNNTVKNKKIGYYGAIAEWFDIEKVEYLAKNLPDIEIELIGSVSYEKCYELKKYKNIKFLGEKNYNELIEYLYYFDVCLIPFRSDIDLIKATNPVKFYEYLSAGKKIVATEIPELEPYRDKFVYLTNENNEFLNYVKKCLDNKDTLAELNDRIIFAKENDWTQRCKEMIKYISGTYKLVSIIIVTYNNLDYTEKCIKSILDKSAYPNFEIIIVDNASKDDTPKYLIELEKDYDNITVILNNENKGFAGGNNDGLRIAKGEYLILLNNDTLVTRGWINGLVKHIGVNNIGMVCPVTNSIGNEAQIKVGYKDIRDMDKFAIEYTTKNYNKLYKNINVLAMFCVSFSREVFNKVGYLDENYKIGMFEDDDYSAAVKQAGYKIACVEDVFIHHFGNVSFKKLEDKTYRKIFETNKAYYEKKWDTIWTPHEYRDENKN